MRGWRGYAASSHERLRPRSSLEDCVGRALHHHGDEAGGQERHEDARAFEQHGQHEEERGEGEQAVDDSTHQSHDGLGALGALREDGEIVAKTGNGESRPLRRGPNADEMPVTNKTSAVANAIRAAISQRGEIDGAVVARPSRTVRSGGKASRPSANDASTQAKSGASGGVTCCKANVTTKKTPALATKVAGQRQCRANQPYARQ